MSIPKPLLFAGADVADAIGDQIEKIVQARVDEGVLTMFGDGEDALVCWFEYTDGVAKFVVVGDEHEQGDVTTKDFPLQSLLDDVVGIMGDHEMAARLAADLEKFAAKLRTDEQWMP